MTDSDLDSPFAVIAKHQKSAPVSVGAIARDLGIKVHLEFLGQDISGMLTRDRNKGGPSGFAIYVNSMHHPNRQRFTLAHEIAHFILHRDLIDTSLSDDTMYRSLLSSYYETQANRLAADILLPIMLVKAALKARPDASPQDLAKEFGVSPSAMQIRMNGIKRLS